MNYCDLSGHMPEWEYWVIGVGVILLLGGAASVFMFGAIIGGAAGAAISGLNYAFGGVKIIGSTQKTSSLFHQFASNVQTGKMSLAISRYSKIHLNRSKVLGIRRFRPDVIGGLKNGNLRAVEVVSSSQTYVSQLDKVGRMLDMYSHISSRLTINPVQLILNWCIF